MRGLCRRCAALVRSIASVPPSVSPDFYDAELCAHHEHLRAAYGISPGDEVLDIGCRVSRRRLAAPAVSRQKMWFATAKSSDRLIASEPFSDLPGVWHEIDESSAVIVRSGGQLEHEPFHP